jgi:hypothetical protein
MGDSSFGLSRLTSLLETNLITALQLEHIARLRGRRNGMTEFFEDAAHLGDLLGIGGCELAAADVQRVFEAHAYVAAHHRGLGREGNLRSPGGKH